MSHHERLSATEAAFLDLEDERCGMHVAALLLFDAGPLANAHGGVDFERVQQYIAARLHLAPRLRQRLAHVPFLRHPVWIDDARFQLSYHLRHTALPRPGDARQLKALCGRILSQRLDRSRPLWELWVVEGLADGRFALIGKVHHCMADGIAGFELLAAILSPSPEERPEPPPPWTARPAPGALELIGSELRRRASMLRAAGEAASRAAKVPRSAAASARDAAAGLLDLAREVTQSPVPIPLNAPVGPHRRFEHARFELDAVKAVKRALGGTVNDVVLAMVTGALRPFLAARGESPGSLPFRALVPVSVRSAAQRGLLGDRMVPTTVDLPLHEADRRARYAGVVAATSRLKASRLVSGTEAFEELGDLIGPTAQVQAMRLINRRVVYNLMVTNIPGPPVPLYLLGAPLREAYPMAPLFSHQPVNVGVFSYAGGLFFGLEADWEAVPDLQDLAAGLGEELEALGRLARDSGSSS